MAGVSSIRLQKIRKPQDSRSRNMMESKENSLHRILINDNGEFNKNIDIAGESLDTMENHGNSANQDVFHSFFVKRFQDTQKIFKLIVHCNIIIHNSLSNSTDKNLACLSFLLPWLNWNSGSSGKR
jgi:hypothetical protein